MNTVEKRSRDRGDKGSKRELVPSAAINGRIVGTKNGKIYNDLPLPLPVALIPSYFRAGKRGREATEGTSFIFPRVNHATAALCRREGEKKKGGGEKGNGENRWTDKGGSMCQV